MLEVHKSFAERFSSIQRQIVPLTDEVFDQIKPGMSEADIANIYEQRLSAIGLKEHWYPILVCAGSWTGQSISRRIHLPSTEVVIQENDIIMLDCTPIKGGVWGNWARTYSIGKNSFYKALCADCDEIVGLMSAYAKNEAKNIGDIFEFGQALLSSRGLVNLDKEGNLGHTIFQVSPGQRVEDCPPGTRVFINEGCSSALLEGILSIEPQLGRINPEDGIMYGAKQQQIVEYPA